MRHPIPPSIAFYPNKLHPSLHGEANGEKKKTVWWGKRSEGNWPLHESTTALPVPPPSFLHSVLFCCLWVLMSFGSLCDSLTACCALHIFAPQFSVTYVFL
eukprot:RCo037993